MTEVNHHPLPIASPIDIRPVHVYDAPVMGYSPSDLTELGAVLATSGMTTLQARAIMAKIQQVAAQVATTIAPDLLDEVRKIQEARILEMMQRIRLLPNMFGTGYVSRDRVIQIIQDVATRTPRQ